VPPRTPIRETSAEEGRRLNEEGLRLLGNHQLAEAEKTFRASIEAAPLVPAGHNNLALAVFAQGRIQEAIWIQEFALRKIPLHNPFGRANVVQFYLTAGRESDAQAAVAEALRYEPREAFALGKQCEALARLGRHRDVLDHAGRYRDRSDGIVCFFAGVAAANLGSIDVALDWLRGVGQRDPHRPHAARYVAALKAGRGPDTLEGNWPYFAAQDVIPPGVIRKLTEGLNEDESTAPCLLDNPVVVELLAALLNEDFGQKADGALLDLLGRMRHPRAQALLMKIAQGTFGCDDLRMHALRLLVDKGVLDGSQPQRIWRKGRWTGVTVLLTKVTPEAASMSIPDELRPVHDAAMDASRRGRWEAAEKRWREFLVRAPGAHPAHHNLAVALLNLGRQAEAEEHLRKAMEIDPSYLFAPSTLAIVYLSMDRKAEAQALLRAVKMPASVHPEALVALCLANCQVAAAHGEWEETRRWSDMAATADPDNPNVRKIRRLLKLPAPFRKLGRRLQRMETGEDPEA
jgi:tetratricopeptide (TPR) repeat protein